VLISLVLVPAAHIGAMAHSSPHQDQQGASPAPRNAGTREDVLCSLVAHRDLFEDIDNNHPEGDVRQRFLGLRAIRSSYVESKVREQECAYNELVSEVNAGKANVLAEKRFEEVMVGLDEALSWNSKFSSCLPFYLPS